MIKYVAKTHSLDLSGDDLKLIKRYAKEHKLTVRDVVYLALMNGIAAGHFTRRPNGKNSKKSRD